MLSRTFLYWSTIRVRKGFVQCILLTRPALDFITPVTMYVIANYSTEGGLTKVREAVNFLVCTHGKLRKSASIDISLGSRRSSQSSSWFHQLLGFEVRWRPRPCSCSKHSSCRCCISHQVRLASRAIIVATRVVWCLNCLGWKACQGRWSRCWEVQREVRD